MSRCDQDSRCQQKTWRRHLPYRNADQTNISCDEMQNNDKPATVVFPPTYVDLMNIEQCKRKKDKAEMNPFFKSATGRTSKVGYVTTDLSGCSAFVALWTIKCANRGYMPEVLWLEKFSLPLTREPAELAFAASIITECSGLLIASRWLVSGLVVWASRPGPVVGKERRMPLEAEGQCQCSSARYRCQGSTPGPGDRYPAKMAVRFDCAKRYPNLMRLCVA